MVLQWIQMDACDRVSRHRCVHRLPLQIILVSHLHHVCFLCLHPFRQRFIFSIENTKTTCHALWPMIDQMHHYNAVLDYLGTYNFIIT